jgi:hypothetical protein
MKKFVTSERKIFLEHNSGRKLNYSRNWFEKYLNFVKDLKEDFGIIQRITILMK